MPTPHGYTAREKKFLLRMTEAEDRFVRSEATRTRRSLNDVITGMIAAHMPPEPPPAPEPVGPKKRRPLRGGGRPRDIPTPPADEAIPGQTSVLDDDQ